MLYAPGILIVSATFSWMAVTILRRFGVYLFILSSVVVVVAVWVFSLKYPYIVLERLGYKPLVTLQISWVALALGSIAAASLVLWPVRVPTVIRTACVTALGTWVAFFGTGLA
jgi:hypothetical protein